MNKKNSFGSAFIEYATIIGVVTAVLISMNTYVKRGMQGRLKQMTDYFISGTQEAESNPATVSSYTSYAAARAGYDERTLAGGRTQLVSLDTKHASSIYRSDTAESTYFPGTYVPGDAGDVVVPPRRSEKDFEDTSVIEEAETDISASRAGNALGSADGVREGAEVVRAQAQNLKDEAQNMRSQANNMDCGDDNACLAERRELFDAADELDASADRIRNKAKQDLIEKRNELDALKTELRNQANNMDCGSNAACQERQRELYSEASELDRKARQLGALAQQGG